MGGGGALHLLACLVPNVASPPRARLVRAVATCRAVGLVRPIPCAPQYVCACAAAAAHAHTHSGELWGSWEGLSVNIKSKRAGRPRFMCVCGGVLSLVDFVARLLSSTNRIKRTDSSLIAQLTILWILSFVPVA